MMTQMVLLLQQDAAKTLIEKLRNIPFQFRMSDHTVQFAVWLFETEMHLNL